MSYVGCIITSGKTIKERFEEHLSGWGGATYLLNAIKKHGREWFTIQQIDAANNPEQALELERWWIKRIGTKAPNGYNLTDGGDGIPGYKHSEETRQKIKEKRQYQVYTPETRQKMSESAKLSSNPGRFTNEHIRSLESRKKQATTLLGHPVSEQTRKKLSTANKGQVPWTKGRTMPEAFRAKMREVALLREAKKREQFQQQ